MRVALDMKVDFVSNLTNLGLKKLPTLADKVIDMHVRTATRPRSSL